MSYPQNIEIVIAIVGWGYSLREFALRKEFRTMKESRDSYKEAWFNQRESTGRMAWEVPMHAMVRIQELEDFLRKNK